MKQQSAMSSRLFCSLLEQLELAEDGIVFLAPEQLAGRDSLALQGLQAAGLIQKASPLTEVVCDGCDWHCTKPVGFRYDSAGIVSEAFVICDERDDIGRARVALGKLEMLIFSLAGMADWIASTLQTDTMPKEIEAGNVVYIGAYSIKDKRHDLFLCRRLIAPRKRGSRHNRNSARHWLYP